MFWLCQSLRIEADKSSKKLKTALQFRLIYEQLVLIYSNSSSMQIFIHLSF